MKENVNARYVKKMTKDDLIIQERKYISKEEAKRFWPAGQEEINEYKELFLYRPPSSVFMGLETIMTARERFEYNKKNSEIIEKCEETDQDV
jgi:hypothetical protein